MAKKTVLVPKQIKYFNDKHELCVLEPGVHQLDDEVLNNPHVKNHKLAEFDPAAEGRKARAEAKAKAKAALEAAEKAEREAEEAEEAEGKKTGSAKK